jgi:hypothetical protein
MNVSAKIAYAIRSTVFATRSGVTCGRHVAQDQARVACAERPRPLDVDALADALRLGAQEPRRERPVDDPDDHDDVPRAAAEQGRDDDDQRTSGITRK